MDVRRALEVHDERARRRVRGVRRRVPSAGRIGHGDRVRDRVAGERDAALRLPAGRGHEFDLGIGAATLRIERPQAGPRAGARRHREREAERDHELARAQRPSRQRRARVRAHTDVHRHGRHPERVRDAALVHARVAEARHERAEVAHRDRQSAVGLAPGGAGLDDEGVARRGPDAVEAEAQRVTRPGTDRAQPARAHPHALAGRGHQQGAAAVERPAAPDAAVGVLPAVLRVVPARGAGVRVVPAVGVQAILEHGPVGQQGVPLAHRRHRVAVALRPVVHLHVGAHPGERVGVQRAGERHEHRRDLVGVIEVAVRVRAGDHEQLAHEALVRGLAERVPQSAPHVRVQRVERALQFGVPGAWLEALRLGAAGEGVHRVERGRGGQASAPARGRVHLDVPHLGTAKAERPPQRVHGGVGAGVVRGPADRPRVEFRRPDEALQVRVRREREPAGAVRRQAVEHVVEGVRVLEARGEHLPAVPRALEMGPAEQQQVVSQVERGRAVLVGASPERDLLAGQASEVPPVPGGLAAATVRAGGGARTGRGARVVRRSRVEDIVVGDREAVPERVPAVRTQRGLDQAQGVGRLEHHHERPPVGLVGAVRVEHGGTRLLGDTVGVRVVVAVAFAERREPGRVHQHAQDAVAGETPPTEPPRSRPRHLRAQLVHVRFRVPPQARVRDPHHHVPEVGDGLVGPERGPHRAVGGDDRGPAERVGPPGAVDEHGTSDRGAALALPHGETLHAPAAAELREEEQHRDLVPDAAPRRVHHDVGPGAVGVAVRGARADGDEQHEQRGEASPAGRGARSRGGEATGSRAFDREVHLSAPRGSPAAIPGAGRA